MLYLSEYLFKFYLIYKTSIFYYLRNDRVLRVSQNFTQFSHIQINRCHKYDIINYYLFSPKIHPGNIFFLEQLGEKQLSSSSVFIIIDFSVTCKPWTTMRSYYIILTIISFKKIMIIRILHFQNLSKIRILIVSFFFMQSTFSKTRQVYLKIYSHISLLHH